MSMCFADNQQRGPPPCGFCGAPVEKKDEIVVERKSVHKGCFKCAECGDECKVGASLAKMVSGYGWTFFCGVHKLLSPGEQANACQKAGYVKKTGKKGHYGAGEKS